MECPYKNCDNWNPSIPLDGCDDCCDGRFVPAVSEYASTCDGCGKLTSHEEMRMDEDELGYCPECATKMDPSVFIDDGEI